MLVPPGLPAYRPRRVLYYYHLDPQVGLMYLRLQTWFPDTMQVYVNGHDRLAWQPDLAETRLHAVRQCLHAIGQPAASSADLPLPRLATARLADFVSQNLLASTFRP